MLSPYDYGHEALYNDKTRALMQKITFEHGGWRKIYENVYGRKVDF